MIRLARTMMARAYAPYSKFHVGAVVKSDDGSIHGGCNVENAAYPQGWCAEVSAIAAMVGAGQRRILECVVMGPGVEIVTPCGGCRQKLREFGDDNMLIHLCHPDGLRRTVTLGSLLPMSFGPHNLGPHKIGGA